VYKAWFKINIPEFLLRPQQKMKKDAILDGELANDFASGARSLRPVIFSHGLFANNISYSGLLKDLASYGYIVFAINHADGTCIYTQNSQGQAIPHGRFEYLLKDLRRN
jgi:predicted dienelactone hydrolase